MDGFPIPNEPQGMYNSKYRRTTAQSIRDHERIKLRIFKLGAKYDFVKASLDNMYGPNATVYTLLSHASCYAEKLNLHIDRLAQRYRQGLICWFTENWSSISQLMTKDNEQKIEVVQPPMKIDYCQANGTPTIDISDFRELLNYH